jgi:Immunity protein 10
MPTSFDASVVAFERDAALNAQYLVLAEYPGGSGSRLEIQRALAVDDQDEARGQDTYCLVADGQITRYGGVRDWRIAGSLLVLELDEETSETFGADAFRIGVPEAERALVEGALLALLP